MADKKISALPAATTPLVGTEVLPIVQGGVTDQISVADLTSGRDVAVKKLNPTDNVVMVAGKGVDFSANGGDVLSQYDEGTWTTTVSGVTNFTGTPTLASGKYTRIGRQVTIEGKFSGTVTVGLTNAYFQFTLPIPRSAATDGGSGSVFSNANLKLGGIYNASADTTTAYLVMPSTSAQPSGADTFLFTYTYIA